MEIATLSGLGPGRVLAGIGHGVQEWMAQMGARPASPLTTLGEVIEAVRALLAGGSVTRHGKVVELEAVQLDQPPELVPPVLAGVRGPRSLELAGRVADGVLLAEPASPTYVRWAVEQAGAPDGFVVAVFSALCVMDDPADARRIMAPWLAGIVGSPSVGLSVLPFHDEMVAIYEKSGVDGLATMPAEWWTELGPIGTIDDAHAHLDALAAAGVGHAGLFLAPDPQVALADVATVGRIVADRSG
jgi:alkanesulfonate monooxygenase SsuD/methylene tetrahydromethanopterin reductase-like flavin-dependent oxidoreductase (luciferase family)